MKLYLDEDLALAIAAALRKRRVDTVSVHELGNVELGDREQLIFATRQGRCLVTGNARDFRSLGHDAVAQRRPHAGIVLCPPWIHGPKVGAIVKALVEIAERYPGGRGEYDVIYL